MRASEYGSNCRGARAVGVRSVSSDAAQRSVRPRAAADEADPTPTARAPRQFEPYSLARMRNLMDDDNAYCS